MDELWWLRGAIAENFRPFPVWFFRWSVKFGLPENPLYEGDNPPLLLGAAAPQEQPNLVTAPEEQRM